MFLMNKLNNNLLSIDVISYESLYMKTFVVNGIFGFHQFENILFKIKYEKDDLISYIDSFDNLKEFILLFKKIITKYNMIYEKPNLFITYKGKRYVRHIPLFSCCIIGEKEISLKLIGFFIYDIKLRIKNTNDSKDIPLTLEIIKSKRETLRIESNSVSYIIDILDLYMNLIFENNVKKIGVKL